MKMNVQAASFIRFVFPIPSSVKQSFMDILLPLNPYPHSSTLYRWTCCFFSASVKPIVSVPLLDVSFTKLPPAIQHQ